MLNSEIRQKVEIIFRLDAGGGWLDYQIQTPDGTIVVKSEQLGALSGTEKEAVRQAFA